jgi:serine phosphatase RsbU (regulator of sigma subunit)
MPDENHWSSRLTHIGSSPDDRPSEITTKNLLIFLAVFMSGGGIVWGSICVYFGLYAISLIPFGYVVISVANVVQFAYFKHFPSARFLQVLISLALPFMFQWVLGGYRYSGVVMLWAVLCLIGSIVLYKGWIAYRWLIFFVLLSVLSLYYNDYFEQHKPAIMVAENANLLLTINICLIFSILFVLTKIKIDNDWTVQHLLEDRNEVIQKQLEALHQSKEEILAQRQHIEQKNRDLKERDEKINESIQAAVHIQQAILPYKGKIDLLLKDYFIIYAPKDGVSGDFYWLHKAKNYTVLVTADCTGHGIPGAFMTMIAHTLLNKIVRVWNIEEPDKILSRLHHEIRVLLRQDELGGHHGMDATVIAWKPTDDDDEVEVIFAGAKGEFYYCLPEKEAQKINGTRKSVGGTASDLEFERHQLFFNHGSMLYLASDGLADQNNHQRERFGSSRVKSMLTQIASLETSQQKETVEQQVKQFMGGSEQRDDILLIGIRL